VTVLLVEDDEAVREATRHVLEHLGHSVIQAPNVASALEVVRAGVERIDVVLTDAVMPGKSGLDLAEILCAERPDLPVVLMSGYTEEAVSGGRTVPPGVIFVEKPFTGRAIAAALAEVAAERNSRRSPPASVAG
jgi:two-component system, cell cycle sensor histidine kinase and response regulator CckA